MSPTIDNLWIDLPTALRQANYDGAIWSITSEQLNVNLMRLPSGDSIGEHVNSEVDVLLVVFDGVGAISLDDTSYAIRSGQALLIPRGVRRALHCTSGPLVYLTCHQRRAGLMPS